MQNDGKSRPPCPCAEYMKAFDAACSGKNPPEGLPPAPPLPLNPYYVNYYPPPPVYANLRVNDPYAQQPSPSAPPVSYCKNLEVCDEYVAKLASSEDAEKPSKQTQIEQKEPDLTAILGGINHTLQELQRSLQHQDESHRKHVKVASPGEAPITPILQDIEHILRQINSRMSDQFRSSRSQNACVKNCDEIEKLIKQLRERNTDEQVLKNPDQQVFHNDTVKRFLGDDLYRSKLAPRRTFLLGVPPPPPPLRPLRVMPWSCPRDNPKDEIKDIINEQLYTGEEYRHFTHRPARISREVLAALSELNPSKTSQTVPRDVSMSATQTAGPGRYNPFYLEEGDFDPVDDKGLFLSLEMSSRRLKDDVVKNPFQSCLPTVVEDANDETNRRSLPVITESSDSDSLGETASSQLHVSSPTLTNDSREKTRWKRKKSRIPVPKRFKAAFKNKLSIN